jgi:hypothetical protein
LEEDGKIVVFWLSPDFFDSFQFIVCVEVESINRRTFVLEVINGPANVNSRSIICGLKYKNYCFELCFKVWKVENSNLRKFADSAPFFFFQLPDSSLKTVTYRIVSAEQQDRSIFQSNKAVIRNFPQKYKLSKIIKNLQRMVG